MTAALLSGLALGIALTKVYDDLTYRGSGRPTCGQLLAAHGWAARIGRSRWRYANLPAGGLLLAVAGVTLDWPDGTAAGVGAAIAAVAMRWLDPLPPAGS